MEVQRRTDDGESILLRDRRFSSFRFHMKNDQPRAGRGAVRPHSRALYFGVRAAVVGASAFTAFGLLSTGAANADTFVPLPNGEQVGDGVKIDRYGESANIFPSMSDNGVGRDAMVSGTVIAKVDKAPTYSRVGPFNTPPANNPGTNNSNTHGASQLNTGYIVGCQVAIGTSAISAGGGVSVSTTSVGASGSVSLQLGPGQVAFVQVSYKDILHPGTYSITYRDAKIDVQGCGGYAQARAYTNVEVLGNFYSRTTLYGQPFSIG
ncbi:MspA family porin [Nocardia alni]|uniref:MspA family porin n=1 Tax=Nocardia alni TaxID=2815723 RepID=UPI003F68806A